VKEVKEEVMEELGSGNGKYYFVGKWRGYHGKAVGLCTASLVAPEWVITAGHCAVRYLRKETIHAQVEFAQGGGIKRGVTSCVHAHSAQQPHDRQLFARDALHLIAGAPTSASASAAPHLAAASAGEEADLAAASAGEEADLAAASAGEDVALCKIKTPLHAFPPIPLNADVYRSSGPHGRPVLCVGTSGGYHAVGPKPLEYEASGAHIYVSNSGGSGMKAGDSGGAWLHTKRNSTTNETHFVLSGVIHGGEGKGTHKRGVAGQPSHVRAWIDQTTGGTARWVSVLEDHM